ncbi:MAG: 6-carboxytetrahydropterin synthase [Chloroflexota bacterium]
MFTVGVSDHTMIAHSLRGATFGPAQRLHGATYEVRVELSTRQLDADSIVVDIGHLKTVLRSTLAILDYQNLDGLAELRSLNTTTEVLCQWIHTRLAAHLTAMPAAILRVTLVESPNAWASYEGSVSTVE